MYNPQNHYWLHHDETKVYHSGRQGDFSATDATYRAWLSDGNFPTRYPSDEDGNQSKSELAKVLAVYEIKMPPLSITEIAEYATNSIRQQRLKVEYGGFFLDGQRWDSAEKDELRLNSAMRFFDGGMEQYDGWKIAEGVYITLTPALVQRAAFALMQHYGNAFRIEAEKLQALQNVLAQAEAALVQENDEKTKSIIEAEFVADIAIWLKNTLKEGW